MTASSNSTHPAPRRRGHGAGHVFAVIGKVLGTILLVGVLTCALMACFAAVYIRTVILPQSHLDLTLFETKLSSTIYYTDSATGQPVELTTLHGSEDRVWVTYDQIPEVLVNAAVAIEDKRFWTHDGVDWGRTAYGVLSMFTGQDIQGGSTIMTQNNEVTVKRKIQEIFQALELDKNYDKTVIMEYYLNYIYFGHGRYGVSTAAEYYFGKEVSQLDLAESAVLISITNNPSMYDPYNHPENNYNRAYNVLYQMLDQGMISQSEYDAALARIQDIPSMLAGGTDEDGDGTSDTAQTDPSSIYPWYVEQVIDDVTADLMEQYGYSEDAAADVLYFGGLSIYTCMDPDIQAMVDKIYSTQESMPLVSDSGQHLQSAIVIIDPEGNVVALAGALGEKTSNLGYNMASEAHRQPGSSIKPLSAYAPAIDMGLITPYSVFDDTPVMTLGGSAWPSNSYGYYTGRMTVYDAVEISSNPVAARVIQMLGVENSFNFLQERFGISSDSLVATGNNNDLGLAQLGLGGLTNGVTVMEMASAYSVFQRGGTYIEPRTYTQITDHDGNVVLSRTDETGEQVIKDTTAWYMTYMLQNVVQSGTGTDARLSGMNVAGKTGSTDTNNDRWFVGYTPYYTAAVWTGYETPERIRASGNPAAQLWEQVMSQVHEGLENQDFVQPSESPSARSYCRDSGLAPSDACALDPRGNRVGTGYFFSGDAPSQSCDLHQTVEVCTESPITNSDGASTGLYRAAGEFCPREDIPDTDVVSTVTTIALLNYSRESFGGRTARDQLYLMSTWQSYGSCTVHTSEIDPNPTPYDPSLFDINDPTTWPTEEQWPGFDPDDETTWPTATPEPSDLPVPSESVSPSPGVSESPPASLPPAPSESPPAEETPVAPPEGQLHAGAGE